MGTNSTILQKVRHFLFGRANREFLIFLFFFLVAGVFWLLMTLNLNYDKEIRMPVHITNVPKDVMLTSPESDTLNVVVNDKGYSLIGYIYGNDMHAVEVDFATYAAAGGTGTVPAADLLKLVAQSLSASTSIVDVKPERLMLYYNYGEQKRVPVRLQGRVTARQHYFVADTVFSQDSVTVFASRERLDSITYVATRPLSITDINDSVSLTCQLQTIEGVKMVPAAVGVSFTTDILSELSIDNVPIVAINVPAGKQLIMYPSKVRVTFVAGLKNCHNVKAEDFQVVADYNQFKDAPASKCTIRLRRLPEGVSRAQLDVTQVDCFVEGRQ